jgi:dethiobiotin synthetase
MSLKFFIAGTDTNAGKTYVSTQLLNYFNKRGYSTIGIKPVASGCFRQDGKLFNDDALALQAASSIKLDYDYINPVTLEPPVSPNIAAGLINLPLTASKLSDQCHYALNYPADVCIVEGAGGWHTPLNETETMADFVILQQLPVILVVGIRLGCINHAILTFNAMQQAKIRVIGWIANVIDPALQHADKVINTLQQHLSAPYLATVRYHECHPREGGDPSNYPDTFKWITAFAGMTN